MNQYIAAPLELIDHQNLKSDEKNLLTLKYEMFPDDTVVLCKKKDYLIISTDYFSKMDNRRYYTQEEFPLKAVPWIVDTIENGFFKNPEAGGFSDFKRSNTSEFDKQVIGINAMVHCCAENVPGLNIWNGNRKDYISGITPQEWDIPLYMLKDGLLAELKAIAKKYENGTL